MNALAILKHRDAALALIVVALVVAIGLRAPVFVAPESLVGVLTDTSFLFMLTLAQMAVILTRGIDLSVAANLALVGMIAALLSRAHPELPILGVIAASIALGAGLGAVNGALIAFLGIPPIVVTLGTLSIYRGVIFLIAGGAWLTSKDMTPAFLAFPKLSVLGVPILIVIAALVSIGFWAAVSTRSAATQRRRAIAASNWGPSRYSCTRWRARFRVCAAISGCRDTASPIPTSLKAMN